MERLTDSAIGKALSRSNPKENKYYVRLAELEDKLESGRAIEWLPVAIEDDVYIICDGKISITQLSAITIYADIAILHLADNKQIKVWFEDGDYSKKVEKYEADFEYAFSQEQAKARLKELQEQKNG